MRPLLTLLIAMLGVVSSAEARVYRCVPEDGPPTFSDRPCGPAATVVDVKPATGWPSEADVLVAEIRGGLLVQRAAELDRQQRRERREDRRVSTHDAAPRRTAPGISRCPPENAYPEAIRRHEVLPCMTKTEVRRAERMKYNDPNVNAVLLESGIAVEEWFYQRHYATWPRVIWFREGRVTAIQ